MERGCEACDVVVENAGGAESMPRPVRSSTCELVRRCGTAVTQRSRSDEDDSARDDSDLIHGILLGMMGAARRGSPSDYAWRRIRHKRSM